QLRVEPVDRVRGVGAVGRDGAFRAGAPPVPDLHLAIARAHEEDEPLLGVGWIEDRDRIRLVEPGQEEEVGSLAEFVVDVAVASALPRAGDDGEAVSDGGREPLASLDEGGWIEWAHRGNNTTAKGSFPCTLEWRPSSRTRARRARIAKSIATSSGSPTWPSRSATSRSGASSTTSPTTRCARTCCSSSRTWPGAPSARAWARWSWSCHGT